MPHSTESDSSQPVAHQLVELCGGLLPVWARHLATSRSQSESAVSEMMEAFAAINPHLQIAQQQSHQITAALSPADGTVTGLTQACAQALASLRADPHLPSGGAAAIDSALALVREAVEAVEHINRPFSAETEAVAAQVERMFIGFQYQDRISQMLALLEQDMARLQALLAGEGSDAPDLAVWLQRLETQYAMNEQRQNHAPEKGTPGADEPGQETTFF